MEFFWLKSRNEVGAAEKQQVTPLNTPGPTRHHTEPGPPLTAAGLVVGVQGEVGGASADEASDGDGEAEVGAVTVGGGADVPAALSGRVEHQDVHDVVQVALDQGAVLTAALVGPLDAALAPVRPVDVVLELGQTERVGKVIGDHLPVLTWRTRTREHQNQNRSKTGPDHAPNQIQTKPSLEPVQRLSRTQTLAETCCGPNRTL